MSSQKSNQALELTQQFSKVGMMHSRIFKALGGSAPSRLARVRMRPQPLISVRDVEASSRWYQRLLDCQSGHSGAEYERLVSHGQLILQLHHWDVEHHHGPIGDPSLTPGNGVLLWFEVDDFEAAVARSAELRAEIVLPRHRNPARG
jgi:hypothetical protein